MPDNTEYRVTSVATYDADGNNGEGSWDPVPIGTESKYITISDDVTNPAGTLNTNEAINSANIIVTNSDTGSTAWSKFNKFVNRVASNLSSALNKTVINTYNTSNAENSLYSASFINQYMTNVIGITDATKKPTDPILGTSNTLSAQLAQRYTLTGNEELKRNVTLNPPTYNKNYIGTTGYPPNYGFIFSAHQNVGDSERDLSNSDNYNKILALQHSIASTDSTTNTTTYKQGSNLYIGSVNGMIVSAGEGGKYAVAANNDNINSAGREVMYLMADTGVDIYTGITSSDTAADIKNRRRLYINSAGAVTLPQYQEWLKGMKIFKGGAVGITNARAAIHYLDTLGIIERNTSQTYFIILHTSGAFADGYSMYMMSIQYKDNAYSKCALNPIHEGTSASAPLISINTGNQRPCLVLRSTTTAATVHYVVIKVSP